VEVQPYFFLTSALDVVGEGGGQPQEIPLLILQETGWASGPVRKGAENLTATGIQSPDRPVRSESPYRLRSIGPLYIQHII
jgi:hypothetical protein